MAEAGINSMDDFQVVLIQDLMEASLHVMRFLNQPLGLDERITHYRCKKNRPLEISEKTHTKIYMCKIHDMGMYILVHPYFKIIFQVGDDMQKCLDESTRRPGIQQALPHLSHQRCGPLQEEMVGVPNHLGDLR